MRVENLLYRYYNFDRELRSLNDELKFLLKEQYETQITSKLSPTPSKAKGSISDKVLDQVVRIETVYDKKIERISKKIERVMNEQEMVDEAIDELTIDEREILKMKYSDIETTWEEISKQIGIVQKTCYNRHKRAIKTLEEYLKIGA